MRYIALLPAWLLLCAVACGQSLSLDDVTITPPAKPLEAAELNLIRVQAPATATPQQLSELFGRCILSTIPKGVADGGIGNFGTLSFIVCIPTSREPFAVVVIEQVEGTAPVVAGVLLNVRAQPPPDPPPPPPPTNLAIVVVGDKLKYTADQTTALLALIAYFKERPKIWFRAVPPTVMGPGGTPPTWYPPIAEGVRGKPLPAVVFCSRDSSGLLAVVAVEKLPGTAKAAVELVSEYVRK